MWEDVGSRCGLIPPQVFGHLTSRQGGPGTLRAGEGQQWVHPRQPFYTTEERKLTLLLLQARKWLV